MSAFIRILTVSFGGLLAGMVGAGIFVYAGYALAEFFGIQNRETQAYFRLFVAMPIGALLGFLTGATGTAAIAAKRKTALLGIALLGAMFLAASAMLGVRWWTPKQPAQFRVRNNTSAKLERVYLGHDFRRATSLGSIEPGVTTDYRTVDLKERGSFNAVRAVYHGGHVQLTLKLELQTALSQGRYTYVVHEQAGKAALDLVAE